ncbi:MAG: MarR family transcriptional regulator [Nanoarchaeota archaeon]
MRQHYLGFIVILAGLLVGLLTGMTYGRENRLINEFVMEQGTCYLANGTCLHEDRNYTLYIIGLVACVGLLTLGIYLLLLDKTQRILHEQHKEISNALKEAKVQEKQKEEFKAYLAAFTEDEQKVLLAIREQDGIQQSTLRYRTGMSKTSLSLMLKSFEERGLITKKEAGKTNKIFLRKKF